MVRKVLLIVIAVTMAGSLALLGCAPKAAPRPSPTLTPPAEKVYEFKYALTHPAASIGAIHNTYAYKDMVEKLGKGRIKINVIPGGQLGGFTEILGVIQSGAAEMAWVSPVFFTGDLPLFQYEAMPFLVKSIGQRMRLFAYMNENSPELKASWAKYNQYPLGYLGQDSWAIFTTKKPIRTPPDIKGLKIRTAGGTQPLILEALGAVTVTIKPGDTYTALQTGVADGAFNPFQVHLDFKWNEVSKYVTVMSPDIASITSATTINLNLWNSLPQDIKDILKKAAAEHLEYGVKVWIKLQEEHIDKLEKSGNTIIRLTPAEMQQFIDATKGVEAAWLKLNPDGKKVLDMAKAWLKEHPE